MITNKKQEEVKPTKSSHDIVRTMRRAAICAHIAAEEDMASQISSAINEGAERIEMLEKEIMLLRSKANMDSDALDKFRSYAYE